MLLRSTMIHRAQRAFVVATLLIIVACGGTDITNITSEATS